MAITFDIPPLVEVALGRTFLPRPDFLVPHFGAFWERVKSEFPSVAHAPPIGVPGESVVVSDDGVWLPRVWLISADNSRLVQIQQDRLHFNWRKTEEAPEYVRFPAIQRKALDIWASFDSFIREATGSPLQPLVNELSYTNLIQTDELGPFELAERTLRDSVWCRENRFLNAPKALSHSYSFSVPEKVGDLSVTIVTGRRVEDQKWVLKIDLTVKGQQTDEHSFEAWSSKARDFLVAAFKDLTTSEMHKIWKLRDE